MTKEQQQVKEFMIKAGQECPEKPVVPPSGVRYLRLSLHIEESYQELGVAFLANDLTLIADSIADSLVVIYGTAVACGIDIEPIFQEVMRSNMTKFIDGHKREDGKWIKGPSYSPANLAPIIQKQMES